MTTKILYNSVTGEPAVFEADANLADWPDFQEDRPLHTITEAEVRQERHDRLAITDWWATSDRTMTVEQIAYRQALRDVTGQAGFPSDVTWAVQPE